MPSPSFFKKNNLFARLKTQAFPWLALVHTALFTAYWLSNSLFYSDTNDYLTGLLKTRLDFVSLLVWISIVIGLWGLGRLALQHFGRTHRLARLTGWLFAVITIIYIIFFYGSFWMLFDQSPVQVTRLGQMLHYFRIVIDLLIFFGLAWLLRLAVLRSPGVKSSLAALAVLILIWGILLIFPPGSVYKGALPAKPLIIAHRGASFLAPENTLASMQRAVQMGVYGLETDLHISQDGVPYLMHDGTLERTTDVSVLFPGRQKDRAETFTLAEVRRLNAGGWFVKRDPYKSLANSLVSSSQAQDYSQLGVPTLAEQLEIVRQSGKIFIYDLAQPPAGHPNRDNYFDLVLNQVRAAGIDQQVWMLASEDQLPALRAAAPNMIPAAGINSSKPSSPSSLIAAGYKVVNAEYGLSPEAIRAYQAAGLWVNLWTVDEPWQFSRLWLLGVNSLTTSNAGEMAALSAPLFGLPYYIYLIIWILVGIIGLLITRRFNTLLPQR